jgi:4-carboxymuconolactone decarboxylase
MGCGTRGPATGRPGDLVRVGTRGWVGADDTERLRCLAINDARFTDAVGRDLESQDLTPKTLALVRLAALVAVGGAGPSYGAQANAAVGAGATAAEIVDVLVGVVPVIGLPSVVAAAPKLAMALGMTSRRRWNISPGRDVGYPPSRPTAIARRTASLRRKRPTFGSRADLGAGGVTGDEQPLSDLADRQVRL